MNMSKMLFRVLATLITTSVDMATIGTTVVVMLPGSLGQGTYLLGTFLWESTDQLLL